MRAKIIIPTVVVVVFGIIAFKLPYFKSISRTPASELCSSSKPNVIYLDDAGVGTVGGHFHDDVNGIQDLTLILKLEKYMNLITIGSSSILPYKQESIELLKRVVTANNSNVQILSSIALKDKIIQTADTLNNCGRKLNIAIGGSWIDVACALRFAPRIKNYIKISGIGGSNVREYIDRDPADHAYCLNNGEVSNTQVFYSEVVNQVPAANVYKIGVEQSTETPVLAHGFMNINCHNKAPSIYSVAWHNQFYDTYISPILRNVIDPITGIRANSGVYIQDSERMNKLQCRYISTSDDAPRASKMRIADFLSIVHILKEFYKTKNKDGKESLNIFNKDEIVPYLTGDLIFKKPPVNMAPIINLLLGD
jgi:hypothetical protein